MTAPAPARNCTYCLRPEADACVRVQGDGTHVYGHRRCALERGVRPLYVFTNEGGDRR
ncbi:hypothetical protein [Streptomyces sp. NPDC057854]|uniref:hypothetical protein n=1 Tax=unclassified Streptomyces TaxID=2593676 RepID=UPI003691FB54